VILSLGITWILDGLEVTLVGPLVAFWAAPNAWLYTRPRSPARFVVHRWRSPGRAGLRLGTDRFGRRKLFFITLIIYLSGVMLTATAWNLWSFCLFRFLTGAGIGGEYRPSFAIDELIPARLRGPGGPDRHGSYWLGAAAGSLSTIVILNPRFLPVISLAPWVRCRRGIGFGGPVPARYMPESRAGC